LLVFPLFLLRSFAYAGVAVVLLAVLEVVEVLPALLRLLGAWVNALNVLAVVSRRRADHGRRPGREGSFWHRLPVTVMRRPVSSGVAAVVVLLLLGSPFRPIQFGLFDDRALPRDEPAHQATEVLRNEFDLSGARAMPVVLSAVGATTAVPT